MPAQRNNEKAAQSSVGLTARSGSERDGCGLEWAWSLMGRDLKPPTTLLLRLT